jgi:hypothetical protein
MEPDQKAKGVCVMFQEEERILGEMKIAHGHHETGSMVPQTEHS